MTSVSEAVATRRSIRQFLPDAVPREVIERVLARAQNTPSGGNVQPWQAIVLAGEPLAAMIELVQAKIAEGPAAQTPEYGIYPASLPAPWRDRRFGMGESMYDALGIARENKVGRLAQFAHNFRAFDAPVLMMVTIPRLMGPPQWSDVGMWLQTIMLLLREEGLDSCAQEAWSVHGGTIRAYLGVDDDSLLFCGLAIGRRDPEAPVNGFPVPRAPFTDYVELRGF